MPGVALGLDLPSLSDTMADVVSKLVTALSAIEDDLAGKIVPSEIDINAALSMAGNALTDVGSLQLVSGNTPIAAGSFYYGSDGEFYVITAAGTIRMSLNGALDITDAGGITGDYGSGNESVSYDNASGEYRFKEDTSVWADIRLDDLILMGTNGSVRLGVDDAVNTDRQFIFKDLPGAGVSALVYNASTSTVESAENTRITNTVRATAGDFSGAVAVGGALTVTGDIRHGDRTLTQDCSTQLFSGTVSLGIDVTFGRAVHWVLSSNGAKAWIPIRGLTVGDRVKSITLSGFLQSGTDPAAVEILSQVNDGSVVAASTASGGPISSTGYQTQTLNSPITIVAHQNLYVRVTNSATGIFYMASLNTVCDRP